LLHRTAECWLQYHGAVLATLVLIACFAAGCVVAAILFVLYGPVPIKRKVTMVSRIQAPLPMAAAPVVFEAPVVGTPDLFAPPVPAFAPSAPPAFAIEPVPLVAATAEVPAAAIAPVVTDHAIVSSQPARGEPTRARRTSAPPPLPAAVRRPAGEPLPLSRSRSARGTDTTMPSGRALEERAHAPASTSFDTDERTSVDRSRRA
jgi:hypothetical protein